MDNCYTFQIKLQSNKFSDLYESTLTYTKIREKYSVST